MLLLYFGVTVIPKSIIVVAVGGGVVVAVTNMCLVLGLFLHLHVHSGPLNRKSSWTWLPRKRSKFLGRKLPGDVVAERYCKNVDA